MNDPLSIVGGCALHPPTSAPTHCVHGTLCNTTHTCTTPTHQCTNTRCAWHIVHYTCALHPPTSAPTHCVHGTLCTTHMCTTTHTCTTSAPTHCVHGTLCTTHVHHHSQVHYTHPPVHQHDDMHQINNSPSGPIQIYTLY